MITESFSFSTLHSQCHCLQLFLLCVVSFLQVLLFLSCLIKLKCVTICLSNIFILQLWTIAHGLAIQLCQSFGRLIPAKDGATIPKFICYFENTPLAHFYLVFFLALGFHFHVLGESHKCFYVTTLKRKRKEETCKILLNSFCL